MSRQEAISCMEFVISEVPDLDKATVMKLRHHVATEPVLVRGTFVAGDCLCPGRACADAVDEQAIGSEWDHATREVLKRRYGLPLSEHGYKIEIT
jgi:hypothetical protein